MLDGFAAHAHGLRVLIEPRLRGLDDVFVFPALDAALVGRCALILERAGSARLRQVNPHFLAIFISGEVVRQASRRPGSDRHRPWPNKQNQVSQSGLPTWLPRFAAWVA